MLTTRHPLPCLVICALLLTGSARADVTPDKLLIYYGFPTSINMSFGVMNAAAHFDDYDLVVLGDGLTNPSHPDHQNTIDIIAHPFTVATTFFGYIDLGVSTQNLSQTEIETRIAGWKAMGADGIFFDDFGYDFGTSRSRQNAAVDAAVDTSDHSYAVTPHPQTPALPPLALGLAISGIVLAHRGLRR